jgi:hypothetical protein
LIDPTTARQAIVALLPVLIANLSSANGNLPIERKEAGTLTLPIPTPSPNRFATTAKSSRAFEYRLGK